MRFQLRLASLAVASVVLLAFGADTANAAPNKCLAGKVKCVSKKKSCKLGVIAKAYKTNLLDAAKLQKCEDKFDGAADPTKGCFEKLEATAGCVTLDDTAALEAKVDAFVADVREELDPGSVTDLNPCTAAKLKCVSKKDKCILGVHSKGYNKGLPPDLAKLQKCIDKFDGGADPTKGCFEKAEAKPPCLTYDDTAALEAKIDAFDLDVICELDPAATGCCPQPGDPCPTTVETSANASLIDLDTGWTGQSHDAQAPTMGRLTLNVSGCANAVRPCGQCSVSGPIENAGGTPFDNHRCQCDNAVQCNVNTDCPGSCPCVFYFGGPLPLSAGGVSVCVTNEITAAVTGTANLDTGTSQANVSLISRVHTGPTADKPCPNCINGMCDTGPHATDPCTVNGVSPLFGTISFDCPPDPGGNIGNLPIPLDLRTGTQTRTLSAANPNCTAAGFTTLECFCDTCNNAGSEPCDDNGDCPNGPDAPGAPVIGAICGGLRCLGGPEVGDACTVTSQCRRCVGGTNAGASCTSNSECPGGSCPSTTCGRPGKTTQPNECLDSVCTPNTPPDNGSCDEGVCAGGPFNLFCAIDTFRGCTTNADCPLALCVGGANAGARCTISSQCPGGSCVSQGDTCTNGLNRECFTDDNGAVGGDVQVCGVAGPATCDVATPVLGTFFCIPPTASSAINAVSGLPGLGRVTIPSTATFN